MITEFARAKINLALHVTGQRADGYHLLDTLVTFADVGDRLTFDRAPELSLEIVGAEGGGLSGNANNLVLRAAVALREWATTNDKTTPGAKIGLEKNLPISSGIGGGSADAAATLKGLTALWQLDIPNAELMALALDIGADVPMCLKSSPLRGQGVGEEITPVDLPESHMVLANPRVSVATLDVYSALPDKQNPSLASMPENGTQKEWLGWMAAQRNDLQTPAISLAPQIADCLDALNDQSAQFVRMSGSGATCFGIFETAEMASQAANKVSTAHSDWWVAPCSTVC